MANPFEGAIAAIGARFGGMTTSSPFSGNSLSAGSPFSGEAFGAGSPFKGSSFKVQSPFEGGFNVASPFRGSAFGVSSPFGGNPFAGMSNFNPYTATKETGFEETTYKGGTVGEASWAGPATADDNKGLTAQKVEEVIARTRGNSPMRGKGQLILDYANARGVSVPLVMGIFLAESELGTTAGPTWNVAGLGGAGHFQGYANIDEAIKAAIDNLATDTYRGKSVQEQVGNWFVGPQAWQAGGLGASDGQNGTVADYLAGKVAPMYTAFGVPLNQQATGTKTASGGGVGAGMARIWGGGNAPIMQEFGDTDYSRAHPYNYGGDFGMGTGHHGLDIALARGTRLTSPVAGTIVIAGGSGYYKDNQGNPATSGEIRIRMANGNEVILGHTSQVSVRVGQVVRPGDFVGLSGGADGDHLHLEYRIPANTNTGQRAVDPRDYLK